MDPRHEIESKTADSPRQASYTSSPMLAPRGRLPAIWLKRMRRGPLDAVERARLTAHQGLLGNTDQGGRRQVTLRAQERWHALMAQLGAALPPSARRAHRVRRGMGLVARRQRVRRLGACRLRMLGETTPCERLDEAWPGVRAGLSAAWGGGACGAGLDAGASAVGAPVPWLEEAARIIRGATHHGCVARLVRCSTVPGSHCRRSYKAIAQGPGQRAPVVR